jgi:DNA (cytosine-5)-methyltransferase 1
MLAWEQVPTVLPVWEACAEVLRAEGWNVWTGLLHAEQYGVPQTRKRAFLLASRDHEVAPPAPTHSRYYSHKPEKLDEGVQKWVSMAEALGWCECARTVRTGQTRCWRVDGCGADGVMVSNYGTGGDSDKRGERRLDMPAPTVTSKIDRNKIYFCATNDRPNAAKRTLDAPAPTLAFGHERPRWCFERPATTVVGSYCPDVIAAPGYRTDVSRQNAPGSVLVKIEEAGVLQSFPAEFPWNGGPKDAKGKKFLQCGNAVPPLLARAALSVVVP